MGGLYGFMLREAFPHYGPHKTILHVDSGSVCLSTETTDRLLSEVQDQLKSLCANKIKRPKQKRVNLSLSGLVSHFDRTSNWVTKTYLFN